ncbi:MAG: glyoxalase [Eubacterium sp.]|nr:glyoxalase [Eubacterium sp.]
MTYDKKVLQTFLDHQLQLLPEKIANDYEEADAFLEDCFAVVVNNLKEVKAYFEEEGVDVAGMSTADIEQAQEVFKIDDGRYLIVEA